MSEMMLALLGFATIIMIIVLLLRNVTVPAIAFIGVSTVTALILVLTGTFSIGGNGRFYFRRCERGSFYGSFVYFFCVVFWNYVRCGDV